MKFVQLVLLPVSYFIGSIPWGVLVSKKFFGIDLRNYGSKNIGFTNAFRTLGLLGGMVVLVADVSKGIISVLIARAIGGNDLLVVLSGLAAILGHNWSIFLRFSGGKGVATAAGVILGLSPRILFMLLAIWLIVLIISKYVSLASIITATSFPLLVVFFYRWNLSYIIFSILVALVIIIRHRSNIKRLLSGSELPLSFLSRKGGNLGA